MSKHIAVIGSGFSGIVAAGVLAHNGLDVTVYEKNGFFGGRASSFQKEGFHFDKGPSWYWMPDVYEASFAKMGRKRADYYDLLRLDPGFRVYFDKEDYVDIPDDYDALRACFEDLEVGAADNLDKFMQEAAIKYEIGIKEMARMPGVSILEFASLSLLRSAMKMNITSSVSKVVRKLFTNEKLRKIMEFPVLFLGASAENTPALYTMMNYAGMKLGTYYPTGGYAGVVDGFKHAAEIAGVTFENNSEVSNLHVKDGVIKNCQFKDGKTIDVDSVIAAGDYAHMERLLLEEYRNYNDRYWESRVFAPSALLFYVGVDKKIDNIQHHNLFFHSNFDSHIKSIYESPEWPDDPLYYVCCPSKTDDSVAPYGCENLFFLVPLAIKLEDSKQIREHYFESLITSFESITGQNIKDNIIVKESYCISDFKNEYHAYGGNAYGLANTLQQTAILKPSIVNKRISNLLYTGQLTVPGPGVPPALISGEIVADFLLNKRMKIKRAV